MDDHHAEPMSPRLLLSLWRERWNKPAAQTRATGFWQGRFDRWIHWLTYGSVWALPGVTIITVLCCMVLANLVLVVQLALHEQIIFSVFMVCLALYVRRYAGHFVTLLLLGLSAVMSARYLYWRLTATLATDFDSNFFIGLCLCLAELHLWLLAMTGAMKELWPVKKVHIPLPSESAGWPEVDIFILCDDQTLPIVQSAAAAALALSWPKRMLKVYLLDNCSRDAVKRLADSMAITYLTPADDASDRTSRISQAVAKSSGHVITILQCHSNPGVDFLKMTLGWFLRDTNLAMLQTPGHFLAPPPSPHIMEIFGEPTSGLPCALIRRSMLNEVNGIETGPVSKRAHTALKLQAAGYSTGYLGLGGKAEPITTDVFMAYRPFGDYSLRWKLELQSVNKALGFFRPIPRLFFFCAPAAYLLLDLRLIETSVALLGAYALPHLIHGYISKERKNSGHRFNEWTELLEMLLAWHILCWTTLTLVWTEITNWRNLLRRTSPVKPPAFKWKAVLPYLALFVLNLAALTSGVTDLATSPRPIEEMTVLFVVWAIYNVMFFTAMLAVAEESRQIRLHTSMQRHLPAMVRLPSGRTVSCTTENFPERSLALQLPMPVAIESEMTVSISIFHNNHEFSFPARVALAQDLLLRVEINGPAQNVYNALAVAAYSRGQDWPKWLPARDADHPLPKWLAPALATLRHRAFRRVTDFGKLMGRQLNRVRMQIGKKK
jgi:cellulose synthase (UDP-forming)